MLDSLVPWILSHAYLAPWIVFSLALLAGCNLPISIDILLVVIVVIANSLLPEMTYPLFFAFTLGCIFSAWIAYWIGRGLGNHVSKTGFFKAALPPERIQKITHFYERFGFLTFLCGRFIPFGVRNCLFMSSGISRISFKKFALFDALACSIWASLFFFSFLHLGHSYDALMAKLKVLNIYIFAAFGVALIGLICYKVKKGNNRLK